MITLLIQFISLTILSNKTSKDIENLNNELEKANVRIEIIESMPPEIIKEEEDTSRGLIKRTPMSLPPTYQTNGSFKAYMDFRAITNTSSKQYELQRIAYTNENGFRMIESDYMVAVGSFYTENIGDRFYIKLENGKEFTVIIGDIKQDRHTDDTGRFVESNGNILEFIIDTTIMNKQAIRMGDISYAGFEGGIVNIERIVE